MCCSPTVFFGQVSKIHHDYRGYTNKYLRDYHNPFDESLWTLQVSHMTCATELSPLPCCNSKVAAAAIFNGSSDAFCAVSKQGSARAKQATGYKTPSIYKRMSDILPRYQFKCCWPSLPRQSVKNRWKKGRSLLCLFPVPKSSKQDIVLRTLARSSHWRRSSLVGTHHGLPLGDELVSWRWRAN
jgi:hypothetical protein